MEIKIDMRETELLNQVKYLVETVSLLTSVQ